MSRISHARSELLSPFLRALLASEYQLTIVDTPRHPFDRASMMRGWVAGSGLFHVFCFM